MSLSGKSKLQQHDCEQLDAMKPWVRMANDSSVKKLVYLERKERKKEVKSITMFWVTLDD